MASSGALAFVPRKLGQAARAQQRPAPATAQHTTASASLNPPPPQTAPTLAPAAVRAASDAQPSSSTSGRAAGKQRAKENGHKDADLARLLELALSDYALWADTELRAAVAGSEDGFLPLAYLLEQSAYLSTLKLPPSGATLARAVRTHSNASLEARIALAEPSKQTWRAYRHAPLTDSGGYDVRRRDWSAAVERAEALSQVDVDTRTVYVERVPHAYWPIPALARLVDTLLPPPQASSSSSDPPPAAAAPAPPVVQHIILPAHHRDAPGAMPQPKGFATLVLSSTAAVEQLLEAFPWDEAAPRALALACASDVFESAGLVANDLTRAAHASGFRALPQVEFARRQEEYLAYHAQLLGAANAHARQRPAAAPSHTRPSRPAAASAPVAPATRLRGDHVPATGAGGTGTDTGGAAPDADGAGVLAYDSPFPPGCLLFVRHVHPQTSRTALRTLLSRVLGADAGGVDYVDYAKGTDSCHVRVVRPAHAQTLAAHFTTHPTAQVGGADDTGALVPAASADARAISVEIVAGAREALYWEKVPAHLRHAAVVRALGGAEADGTAGATGTDGAGTDVDKPKRKRRRK